MGSVEIIMLAKIVSDLVAIIYLERAKAAGMSEQQKLDYWQQQKTLTDQLMQQLIHGDK